MNRFFNLIGGDGRCLILLYGDIGEYSVSSGSVARELIEAEKLYGKIDVRINSAGGDVMAGIAIFNAFRNSKADITIYIDGVAASIASVIAACGKPVQMSKYAKLMLHSVSGGAYGNYKEIESYAEAMKDVEETLVDIYAGRTGMTTEEIKSKYFDGRDHWLSADEALSLGFIDGIYDADPVPEGSTPEQVYSIFQNRLKQQTFQNNPIMFEKLKKRKAFANCADMDAAEKVIDTLEAKAEKADALEAENKELKAANDGYKQKEKEAHEAQIESLVNEAHEEERIGADEVDTFKNVLRNDFENGKKLLESRKAKRRVMKTIEDESGTKSDPWEARMKEIKENLKK